MQGDAAIEEGVGGRGPPLAARPLSARERERGRERERQREGSLTLTLTTTLGGVGGRGWEPLA